MNEDGSMLDRVVLSRKVEHEQIRPREGWLEHDAEEIFSSVVTCVNETASAIRSKWSAASDDAAACLHDGTGCSELVSDWRSQLAC